MEPLPEEDFREFLRLLSVHRVRYLLVGGYAVGFHGYARATMNLDVWVDAQPVNAERLVAALREFGFDTSDLRADLFLDGANLVRLGRPPVMIDILMAVSGLDFSDCHTRKLDWQADLGLTVAVISLEDLRANKLASGRHRDLDDLEHL